MDAPKKNAVCGTCTLKLVAVAYCKAPWFRAVREPLKLGMRILSRLYRVNPAEYTVRTPACYGCIRFHKVALKEKSAAFRWLNNTINPIFDYCLGRLVPKEVQQQANRYAEAASRGQMDEDRTRDWMRGLKAGF